LYILPGAKSAQDLNGQKSPLSSLDGLTFICIFYLISLHIIHPESPHERGGGGAYLLVHSFSL